MTSVARPSVTPICSAVVWAGSIGGAAARKRPELARPPARLATEEESNSGSQGRPPNGGTDPSDVFEACGLRYLTRSSAVATSRRHATARTSACSNVADAHVLLRACRTYDTSFAVAAKKVSRGAGVDALGNGFNLGPASAASLWTKRCQIGHDRHWPAPVSVFGLQPGCREIVGRAAVEGNFVSLFCT